MVHSIMNRHPHRVGLTFVRAKSLQIILVPFFLSIDELEELEELL